MPSLQLGLLDTKNPEYDAKHRLDLRALYKGGKAFRKRIDRFLPQRPVEPAAMWEVRKKEAHYRNYIAPIVNQFNAVLFSSSPLVRINDKAASGEVTKKDIGPEDDFYTQWRADCDGNGKKLENFFQERLAEAMVEKTGYFVIEHPEDDPLNPATDQASFKARGLDQVRLRKIDGVDVYDWERDETGALLWAIVHRLETPRATPSESRDTCVETWEIYTDQLIETYQIKYPKGARPTSKTEQIPQIHVAQHRFGRVPLLELELLEDLWIGELLESPQLAHFRVTNAETWAIARTCYAMPVFNLAEDTKPPTMGAGYGIYLGLNEKMEWSAPPSTPFEATNRTAATLKDEIFRIAQQMAMGVDNNAASVGRSADSKLADAGFMRVVLDSFSRKVKELIEVVYDLVSTARGDKYSWSIEGLDDFNAADLAALMELMTELSAAGSIKSKTFNVELQRRVAEAALPDLPQDKKDLIREEIEDGVEAEEAMAESLRDAAMNPPPPAPNPNPSGNQNPNPNPNPNGPTRANPKPGQRGNARPNSAPARGRAPAKSAG